MTNLKLKKLNSKKDGFTLLVAIVTTSLLLIVSFVVSNIALKQLVLATVSQESQYSYYNADSGIECATYWDIKDQSVPSPFATSTAGANTITCSGQTFNVGGPANNPSSTFTVTLPGLVPAVFATKGCVTVTVTKSYSGGRQVTSISSKGYNTCTAGAQRKYERGVQITY